MTIREALDPELATLRAVIRSIPDKRARVATEAARYNLFAALDQGNWLRAARWLTALQSELAVQLSGDQLVAARAALANIRAEIRIANVRPGSPEASRG
jgi:hypothetical protein